MSALVILRAVWAFVRRIPWQVWALLAAIVFGWWLRTSGYEAGVAAERSSWEKVAIEAKDRAAREKQAQEKAAREHNVEIRRAYEADLTAILADRDSLARRLRNAQAAAARPRCAVPEGADRPGTADAGAQPGGQDRADEIDAAFDAYDRACRADAAQLNRLIEQLQPQL